jgi:hypothetical protein
LEKSRDSSIDIVTVKSLSSLHCPDLLCGPFSFLSGGQSGRDMKLTTHLHPAPRSRMVELYRHSSISLRSIMLNYVSTGTTLRLIIVHSPLLRQGSHRKQRLKLLPEVFSVRYKQDNFRLSRTGGINIQKRSRTTRYTDRKAYHKLLIISK